MQRDKDSYEVRIGRRLTVTLQLMILCRKLTKRIEELIVDSSALKSNLVSALQALSNLTPDLVNFGLAVWIVEVSHSTEQY